eukprot:GILK01007119.1.p1 GENE.GILK01007119.1~~GILK01007119.1.p1  ORF type:complete len:204 (+),score=32.49 GILK01007119.1:38-649(+)
MKRVAAHSERNQTPIFQVLQKYLPQQGKILEIASGFGQHIVFFANQASSDLTWQPSEYDTTHFESINAWREEAQFGNVLPPEVVDVSQERWSIELKSSDKYDGIISTNLVHICPWGVAEGLLRGAGRVLKSSGFLHLYGPYKIDGRCTSESNEEFDKSLQSRNPEWGIRDIADVKRVADANGLAFVAMEPMPANNFSVIFRKL